MDVGSCSSVVRELVAKARGPGFNSLVNAWDFFFPLWLFYVIYSHLFPTLQVASNGLLISRCLGV